jgi:hypothetical protein
MFLSSGIDDAQKGTECIFCAEASMNQEENFPLITNLHSSIKYLKRGEKEKNKRRKEELQILYKQENKRSKHDGDEKLRGRRRKCGRWWRVMLDRDQGRRQWGKRRNPKP